MSVISAAANLLPKSQLFKMFQNGLTKRAGFEPSDANIFIDYTSDKFTLKIWSVKENKQAEKTKPVTEFSDMSGFLLSKVKSKLKADSIDAIDLTVNFAEKNSKAIVYFQKNNEALCEEINEVF